MDSLGGKKRSLPGACRQKIPQQFGAEIIH